MMRGREGGRDGCVIRGREEGRKEGREGGYDSSTTHDERSILPHTLILPFIRIDHYYAMGVGMTTCCLLIM